jgi:hypothetical protein
MKELVKSLESKVTELETKVQRQDSLLTSLLREKNNRVVAANFDSVPISTNQSAVAINGLPSSCSDLKMIGHIWSGFYSVMGSSVMESVYCDFTKPIDDAGKNFIFMSFYELFNCNYYLLLNSITCDEKVSRNGSDTTTSNQRPSISSSREPLHYPLIGLIRFHSIPRY